MVLTFDRRTMNTVEQRSWFRFVCVVSSRCREALDWPDSFGSRLRFCAGPTMMAMTMCRCRSQPTTTNGCPRGSKQAVHVCSFISHGIAIQVWTTHDTENNFTVLQLPNRSDSNLYYDKKCTRRLGCRGLSNVIGTLPNVVSGFWQLF